MNGLALFKLDMLGKTVLLKPNLVEYLPGKEVNTYPSLVGAGAERLLKLWSVKDRATNEIRSCYF
jgi:hypothetical protein